MTANMEVVLAIFGAATFPTIVGVMGSLMSRSDANDLRKEFHSEFKTMSEQLTLIRERLAVLETK